MRNRRRFLRDRNMIYIAVTFAAVFMTMVLGSVLFGTIRAQAAPAETSYKYYTSIQVQSGDTLWGIADTYMTGEYENISAYIDEVCRINHISADEIHAGQYLTIPYYSEEYLW